MLTKTCLFLFISATAVVQLAAAPSFARGTSGSYGTHGNYGRNADWGRTDPVSADVRQPGLWYGDAYAPDDVKAANFRNYSTNSPSGVTYGAAAASGAAYGNNARYTNGVNYANGATYTNAYQAGSSYRGPQGQQFSGPAHIEPNQYRYFVQTYSW